VEARLRGRRDGEQLIAHSDRGEYRLLTPNLIADKRAAAVGLQDARMIDDTVLRRLQAASTPKRCDCQPPSNPSPTNDLSRDCPMNGVSGRRVS